MESLSTQAGSTPAPTGHASRRTWLKGFGALLGSGLLAAPTAAFARPVAGSPAGATATAGSLAAASDLVGGAEYIGMVQLLASTTVPTGWALCDGRVLPAAEHPALFAVLGATYGGDGWSTFALPDMRKQMASIAAVAATQPVGGVPLGQLCAIKVANAPATTTAVAELRLMHLSRLRRAA